MFAQRLKSHHELYNIIKALAISRMDVNQYLKSAPGVPREAVIYIHIPFCQKICPFCTMIRVPGPAAEDYAGLVVKEIQCYQKLDYIRHLIFPAVYFGGGTPTTLSSRAIKEILTAVRQNFRLAREAEVTFESTVSELTEEKISTLQECGVNRISIGVQTFNDRGRRLLGRLGSGKEAYQKIMQMKARGFENVNIDIIYHYPRQTGEEVDEDLNKVFSLELAGFSFYSLITRQEVQMGNWQPGVQMKSSADSRNGTDMALFDRIYTRAVDRGFSILELTKLTRHDPYRYITARHDGANTLALGAGAGGNLADISYMNPVSLKNYRNYVEGRPDTKLMGVVTKPQYRQVSRLIGAIQRCRIPHHEYAGMFGREIRELLERLLAEGLVTAEADGYSLTPKGIYWGNNICDAILENLKL